MSTTRVKDAGFLQQHLEKLILAGGVFILLLVIALFVLGVLGSPFAIEVGGQKHDDPNDAIGVLVQGSETLRRGINDPEPIPPTQVPDFLTDYQAMLDARVDTPGGMAARNNTRIAGLMQPAIYPTPVPPVRYTEVTPPAPTDVEYVLGTDVLDLAFDPDVTQAFFDLWGERREPADFSMLIAAGEFDIAEWVERLKGEEDATGQPVDPNRIPVGIWAQRFGVAGVALLREELDETTGEWVNRQIVPGMPEQVRLLPNDDAPTNPAEALANVQLLRQLQEQVARPEMPWLIDYVQATPPGGDALRNAEGGVDEFGRPLNEENLGPNERRVRDLEEQIAQLEEQKRLREERQRPRENRPERPRPRRGGGDEFDEGGGDFDDGGGLDDGPRLSPADRQIQRLRDQIERLRPRAEQEREERQRLAERQRAAEEERRRLEALRAQREGTSVFQDEFGDQLGGLGMQGINLAEGATVRVWAADASMQPGKTYRYKLLVAVINPLYAVPRLEPGQLAENQARAALFPDDEAIEAMDWIGPVTIEPKAQFFYTGGSDTRAKVDVYRRVEGYMQRGSFDVSPGDYIGGVVTLKDPEKILPDRDVDMNIGAMLVDIERRRDLSGNTVYTMIFIDEDGNLHERSQAEDAQSPIKRALDREIKDEPEWALRPDPELDLNNGGGFDEGFDEFDEFSDF